MKEPVGDKGRSWAASPCSSCRTSPCCTRLPLHRFHIETRDDFAWAASILAHPRIELGLYDSGWWMVYYLAPCRFLNPLDSKCLVHGSPRRPQVCRDYSPARCWYKRTFPPALTPDDAAAAGTLAHTPAPPAGSVTPGAFAGPAPPTSPASPLVAPMDFIRFDARRLEALSRMITFEENGELSSVPEWELLHARIAALPIRDATAAGRPIERVAPPPAGTASTAAPPAPSGSGSAFPSAPGHSVPAQQSQSGATPGGGLTFPIRTPRTRRDLDLVRFRLGFHGVRVGVDGDEWVTLIGRPSAAVRYLVLCYADFDALFASFTFDDDGTILAAPRLAPPSVEGNAAVAPPTGPQG